MVQKDTGADLVLLSIGFEGTETTVLQSFDIKTKQNKIVANEQDYRTNQEKVFLQEMHVVDKV